MTLPSFDDFDEYVKANKIKPEELGQAFAAFLNLATGWDGRAEKL
jgi:hypothetical protein